MSIQSPERITAVEPDTKRRDETSSILDAAVDNGTNSGYETAEEGERLKSLVQEMQLGLLAGEMLAELTDSEDYDSSSVEYMQQLHADVDAGQRARQVLMEVCMPCATKKARAFTGRGVDRDDLIQEGNVAIVKAIDSYDPSKNVPVKAYVAMKIEWALADAVRHHSEIIRVPKYDISKALEAREQLGEASTHEQIAEATGFSIDRVKSYLSYSRVTTGIDDESIHPSYLIDRTVQSVEDHALSNAYSDTVRSALQVLSPEERELISLRFGIGSGVGLSLRNVGDIVGKSQVYALRKQREILDKLRTNRELLGLQGLALQDFSSNDQSTEGQDQKKEIDATETSNDIYTLRRRMLIALAGRKGLQKALDAETLLDGDDEDIEMYDWSEAQREHAEVLRSKYLAKIASIVLSLK